jgi:hypothetical protein
MKIAFTSCMSVTVFAQQPVRDQIAAQRPDRLLLLLGDSVCIDAPPYPIGMTHHEEMAPVEFLQHVLGRWRTQLEHPHLACAVQCLPAHAGRAAGAGQLSHRLQTMPASTGRMSPRPATATAHWRPTCTCT